MWFFRRARSSVGAGDYVILDDFEGEIGRGVELLVNRFAQFLA